MSDGSKINAGGMNIAMISDSATPKSAMMKSIVSSKGITVLWILAVISLLWNAALTVAFIRDKNKRSGHAVA
jgi:hypothetical protein